MRDDIYKNLLFPSASPSIDFPFNQTHSCTAPSGPAKELFSSLSPVPIISYSHRGRSGVIVGLVSDVAWHIGADVDKPFSNSAFHPDSLTHELQAQATCLQAFSRQAVLYPAENCSSTNPTPRPSLLNVSVGSFREGERACQNSQCEKENTDAQTVVSSFLGCPECGFILLFGPHSCL